MRNSKNNRFSLTARGWLQPFIRITQKMRGVPCSEALLPRNEKIMGGCKRDGIGLEIGASYNPVAPKKAGYRVEVLDHADQNTLRQKYADFKVDLNNIEEVDYVWTGEPLDQLTGKKDYYDWIIASHVIEHTPDLVSFLQQCETMLKPRGLLCLALPDHRYCFDFFRPISTPGDVIQAYLEKRRRHSLGAIWDHCSMITQKGGTVAWSRAHSGDYTLIYPSLTEAQQQIALAQNGPEHIDVHSWCFTPSSFKLILQDLGAVPYIKLRQHRFFNTQGCEFIVQLEKPGDDALPKKGEDRLNLLLELKKESRDFTL